MTSGLDHHSVLAAATARWRDRCLLGDGSVLTEGQIWTLEQARNLVRYYVEEPDLSDRNFFEKLRNQLAPAPPEAKMLAAEMLWVMYLIVHKSSMKPETKRNQVETVWGWSGEPVPDSPDLLGEALDAGVANPGTAYLAHRWRELAYFVRLLVHWKELSATRQRELLGDGWVFGRWLDDQPESKGRQLRHALLFLLYPRQFEPIVSIAQKRAIVKQWYGEAGVSLADLKSFDRLALDRAVFDIRKHLESGGPRLSFYEEPWASQWRESQEPPVKIAEAVEPIDKEEADSWARERFGSARVWAVAAGPGGRLWPELTRKGVIALGLDELNDLTEYESRDELHRAIVEERGAENPVMDSLAAWQFVHDVREGDFVIAKEGRSRLLGWGVVSSGYRHDPARAEYRHLRSVDWKEKGRWNLPPDRQITAKALTEFTGYTRWLHMAFGLMEGKALGVPGPRTPDTGFSLERALEGLFMSPERFSEIVDLLGRKMNVILQGPPGTGKSFIARRIAFRLMDQEDDYRVQMVQFHQAYAYEDFVQGYRPTDDGGFRLQDGVFFQFCRRAAADPERKYVFIIDEINRGNLPRILGELMLLIEADKRDSRYAMPLTYSREGDPQFFVAENVYLLGMMNTADRSLAMVDYALRRRFGFVDLQPEFQSDGFSEYLIEAEVPEALVKRIADRMTRLNDAIAADQKNLGPGFEIGHSYFVPGEQDTSPDAEWYIRVIRNEVEPLLREYWFDQPRRVEEHVQMLLS